MVLGPRAMVLPAITPQSSLLRIRRFSARTLVSSERASTFSRLPLPWVA